MITNYGCRTSARLDPGHGGRLVTLSRGEFRWRCSDTKSGVAIVKDGPVNIRAAK
jgi:hypothetical protein